MKNTLLITFSLLVCFAVASCSKKSTGPSVFMTAMVDGTSFTASTINMVNDSSSGYADHLIITGTNGVQTITLTVLNYEYSAGNYYVRDSATTAVATYTNGVGTYKADSGSVLLSDGSRSGAGGTFNFTTSNNIRITNGQFGLH